MPNKTQDAAAGWTPVDESSQTSGWTPVDDPAPPAAPTPLLPTVGSRLFGSHPLTDTPSSAWTHLKNFVAAPYHGIVDPETAQEHASSPGADYYYGNPVSRSVMRLADTFTKPTVEGLRTFKQQKAAGNTSLTAPEYDAQGNYTPTAASGLIDAFPIVGPWARSIDNEAHKKGVVPALVGAATDIFAPMGVAKGIGVARNFRPVSDPDIVPPIKTAAEKLTTAIVPKSGRAPQFTADAIDQVANVKDYAARTNNPLRTQAEFEEALRGAGKERYDHFQNEIMKPNAKDPVEIGDDYGGVRKDKNHATIGAINQRIARINDLLSPNYAKINPGDVQTAMAKTTPAELNAEAAGLRKTLYKSLSERTGIPPEDIMRLRQDYGKLEGLENAVVEARTGRMVGVGATREGGSGGGIGLPHPSPAGIATKAYEGLKGGRMAIADKEFQKAWGDLQKHAGNPNPLPKPPKEFVESRSKLAEANRLAAQREVEHAANTERAAQDAAKQRTQTSEWYKGLSKDAKTKVNQEMARQEAVNAHAQETAAQDAAAARAKQASGLRQDISGRAREAAQAEAVRAHELEQQAHDAASARSAQAQGLRSGVVGRAQSEAQAEALRAHQLEQASQDAAAGRSAIANPVRNARDAARFAEEKAKNNNSGTRYTAPAGELFKQYMMGPGGRRLGSMDGVNWVDVETRQPISLPKTYVPPPPQ